MATTQIDKTREQYRARIAAALQEDEDPLAVYDNFVKWTVENYQGNLIARSGLLELLEETTRQFKDDEAYKGDLRYLKLWILYASHVEDPAVVFAFVMRNNIGSVYAQVYEEYALALFTCGRVKDAERVLQAGIQRRARPAERLKKRLAELQSNTLQASSKPHGIWDGASPETLALRKNPLKNYPPQPARSTASKAGPSRAPSKPSASKPPPAPPPAIHSPTSLPQDRYAHIRAPPIPGKRPEKLRFDLSLLFTNDNVEYSVQEARARSMGLLGKKWAPPSLDDDTTNFRRSKKAIYAEPTVTLATKEALADVFGMYNSPDKTMKHGTAGSKHAPVRKIQPITPMSLSRLPSVKEGQDPDKTIMPEKPFRNENENAGRKENSVPATTPKFKPFVDENAVKHPAVTPDPGRRVLSVKEPGTAPRTNANENSLRPKTPTLRPVEPKPPALTPAGAPPPASQPLSRQDIFTDEPPPPTSEKKDPVARPLVPFSDPEPAPLKVFSRPPSAQPENAPPRRTALQSLNSSGASRQPFVPVRNVSGQHDPPPMQSFSSSSSEGDLDQEVLVSSGQDAQEDFFDDSTTESDDIDDGYAFVQEGQQAEDDDDDDDSALFEEEEDYSAPLPRRGYVNVMTPITERTYEFTATTRNAFNSNDTNNTFPHVNAAENAEQLVGDLPGDEDHSDDMEDNEERTGTNLMDTLSLASKFNPPNPCNPFDPSIVSTILSLIPADPALHDLRQEESGQLDALQKFTKKKARRSGAMTQEDPMRVTLAGRPYEVLVKLGEGGFGAVFEAIDVHAAEQHSQDGDEEEEEEEGPKVALKVVRPRNLWEFRVLRRIHVTLPAQIKRSIVVPSALYAYRDESFLVMEHCNQGTLLDVVNNAAQAGVTQQGACLDELIVVFFTIELMRLLESLHAAGFIHGDMKIDNCLLRLEDVPGPASAWTSVYQPSGDGGWSYKGIKMIDFGRTIDTRLFPPNQQYTGDWDTDPRDCVEMREGKPWTYQTDYFGLAGIIYCMLYGKYIEASSVTSVPSEMGEKRYKISTPFKRYWNVDLWTRLFDVLLNSGSAREDGRLPLCDEMAALRKEMEAWLQTNCNRGSNSLKGLLKKIGLSLLR
ncbi:hypothetical protein BXZ70DRAFT_197318 [Cristinia sonorae]|uniref:Uncharacterized protein n=1 Tax=Cristinia sonorae TaxID=1940300 RepID=A0A8K0XPU0_9AGAR|nr:hypothetical protein BXZ70DRAFT_197318 [Cristinia sonorae]